MVYLNHHFVSGAQLSEAFYSFSHILAMLSPLGALVSAWYLSFGLKKQSFIRLGFGVVVYWILAYFIKWTRNLNNPDFNPLALNNNHFFQTNGFLIAGVIIILAFLFRILQKTFFKESSLVTFFNKNSFSDGYIFILLFIIMTDAELLQIIKSTVEAYLNLNDIRNYIKVFIGNVILVQVLFLLVIRLSYKAINDFKNNKATFSLTVVTSLLLAIILNFGIQFGIKGDSDLLGKYIFPGATLYQILFLYFIFQFLYLCTNRFILTSIFSIMLMIIAVFANVIKFKMRSEPILVSDLVWLKDITLLLGFISFKFVAILIVLVIITLVLFIFLNKRFFNNKIINGVNWRILGLLSIIAIMGLNFWTFLKEKDKTIQDNIPVISTLNNWNDITWMGFKTNSQFKSLAFVWTKQLTKNVMEKPKDYSKETIKKIVKKYEKEAIDINKSRKNNISDQTVIYILSEGFSDPSRISDVTISKPIIENIQQIKDETTSGLMHSDGYGGGTANMEFQSLTGLPFYNYSDNVSTLYTEVVPKMKTIPMLSNQFNKSERYVLHGSNSKNYNRLSVYKKMGFQHFIFSSGSEETFDNPKNVGVNLSDQSIYDNIINRLNDSNQFFSVITMQNHAPWSIGSPQDISGEGKNYSEQENADLTSYARLMNITDNATKDFLSKLSNIDKKITVVFYGDHLPGLYPQKSFTTEPDSQYETDYFIWSNYQNKKINHPLVNSSDFSAELLEHTDSKVSPYYALLTDIMNDASVDKKDLTKYQKQLREDLSIIQYDITLGKNYISQYQDFFIIGE
ncbi:LTA synthase family protein [Streptococcus pluranimalium]